MTSQESEPEQSEPEEAVVPDALRSGSPSAAERLRRVDRSPALVAALRRARRALPGDPGFGDPLSTAGPGSARAIARVADRVLQDQPGASRELGLAGLQVWQAARERFGRGAGTETAATIVFTDLVGFSSWALAAGDSATLRLLRNVSAAVEPQLQERGGHVVKRMGDGLMAVFREPESAVAAAFAGQSALTGVEVAGYRPLMRVGIHSGTPRRIGGDWLGVDVNIAARVMQAGGDGNVVISEVALAQVDGQWLIDHRITARPQRRFLSARPRGVPDDLRMFVLRSG